MLILGNYAAEAKGGALVEAAGNTDKAAWMVSSGR